MTLAHNPFIVGKPVPTECFVGRESEIRTAFDQIINRSHLAIYGESGIGKSSFLQYLSSPQAWIKRGRDPSSAFIVYFNCMGILPFTPTGFWRRVLEGLKQKANGCESLLSEIERSLAEESIEINHLCRILRKIKQDNKFLVLLIDDYDLALKSHENYNEADILGFLSEFRYLAVHTEEGLQALSIIVSTFRRLNEMGPQLTPNYPSSPWYNHHLFLLLKPFSLQESLSLFSRPQLELLNLQSNLLQDNIFALTGGHPTLLQNAGYLLYERVRDVELKQVERFATEFRRRTEQVFVNTWRLSNDNERILLMLIALSRLEGRLRNRQFALGNLDHIFRQKQKELIDLMERGVILRTTIIVQRPRMLYSFKSSMMEWWVIQEIENTNEEELQRRERVLLNLMSREQVQQVREMTQHLWTNRQTLETLFNIVRKFLGS